MFVFALHTRRLIALVVLGYLPTSALGERPFFKSQAVDRAVMAEMDRQQIVGAAVGIIRDFRVVYTKGYGFANLRARTPVSSETVFNWASNSKPVIAVAAMQLVQKGRLKLDQGIGSYLPNLPSHLQRITPRQLLCHQSGIPHYSNGRIIVSGETVSVDEELDPVKCLHRFTMSPLIFEPGSRTEYSSYAYVLLTAVVQAAGNQPIDQQLSTRIIVPLGLDSFQLDTALQDQRHWTTGYRIVDGSREEVPDYAHFWKHGGGGYKSNVKDFAKFATAIARQDLINANTSAVMWTPQTTSTGHRSTYGLGVVVSGSRQSLKVSHNGSQDETRTRMVVYPNQRNGIVVMCNTQGCEPSRISTAIYSAINQ